MRKRWKRHSGLWRKRETGQASARMRRERDEIHRERGYPVMQSRIEAIALCLSFLKETPLRKSLGG